MHTYIHTYIHTYTHVHAYWLIEICTHTDILTNMHTMCLICWSLLFVTAMLIKD